MHMTPQAVAEAALKPCTHCSGWAPHRRNVHRETGEVAHYQENYGAACQLAARARDWDNKKKWAEEKKRKRESLAVDPTRSSGRRRSTRSDEPSHTSGGRLRAARRAAASAAAQSKWSRF